MDRQVPELHDQFVISRQPDSGQPVGWRTLPLTEAGDWHLAHHPGLPVTRVCVGGKTAGWLLGWAIDSNGLVQPPELEADLAGGEPERWLYGMSGRFAFLMLSPRPRFYLDPCGTLAAVFAEDRPILGSTPTAILGDSLPPSPPVLAPNQFYPAGTTAFAGIRRLLPNHYLDMETWRVVRHWPTRPFARVAEQDSAEVEALAGRVVRRLSHSIEAVARHMPVYLPLSAGRDSRVVVACGRQAVERAQYVTFEYQDDARKPDIYVARRIARKLGLNHLGVPLVEPTEAQCTDYLLRIGYAGNWGKAQDFDLACRRALDLNRGWMTGFGGEIGRAYYWRDTRLTEVASSPEQLERRTVERLNLPRDAATLEAWRAWQRGVPHSDVFELLDLIYIEQRMGCWAGPHMYGAAPFRANLTPFADREVIEAVMSLPVAFRRNQRFAQTVISIAWPELMELPYQQFTGFRRLAEQLKKQSRQHFSPLARTARKVLRRVVRRPA